MGYYENLAKALTNEALARRLESQAKNLGGRFTKAEIQSTLLEAAIRLRLAGGGARS